MRARIMTNIQFDFLGFLILLKLQNYQAFIEFLRFSIVFQILKLFF